MTRYLIFIAVAILANLVNGDDVKPPIEVSITAIENNACMVEEIQEVDDYCYVTEIHVPNSQINGHVKYEEISFPHLPRFNYTNSYLEITNIKLHSRGSYFITCLYINEDRNGMDYILHLTVIPAIDGMAKEYVTEKQINWIDAVKDLIDVDEEDPSILFQWYTHVPASLTNPITFMGCSNFVELTSRHKNGMPNEIGWHMHTRISESGRKFETSIVHLTPDVLSLHDWYDFDDDVKYKYYLDYPNSNLVFRISHRTSLLPDIFVAIPTENLNWQDYVHVDYDVGVLNYAVFENNRVTFEELPPKLKPLKHGFRNVQIVSLEDLSVEPNHFVFSERYEYAYEVDESNDIVQNCYRWCTYGQNPNHELSTYNGSITLFSPFGDRSYLVKVYADKYVRVNYFVFPNTNDYMQVIYSDSLNTLKKYYNWGYLQLHESTCSAINMTGHSLSMSYILKNSDNLAVFGWISCEYKLFVIFPINPNAYAKEWSERYNVSIYMSNDKMHCPNLKRQIYGITYLNLTIPIVNCSFPQTNYKADHELIYADRVTKGKRGDQMFTTTANPIAVNIKRRRQYHVKRKNSRHSNTCTTKNHGLWCIITATILMLRIFT